MQGGTTVYIPRKQIRFAENEAHSSQSARSGGNMEGLPSKSSWLALSMKTLDTHRFPVEFAPLLKKNVDDIRRKLVKKML
jgi:hypothetical protein